MPNNSLARRRPGTPQGLDAFRQLDVSQLDEEIRRLERVATSAAQIGTITVGRPVLASGSLGMPASYATGGIDFTATLVPGIQDVRIMPIMSGASLYTFEWDGGANKVKVFDSASWAEVAAATDLTSLGGQRYLAIGTLPDEHLLYVAGTRELLLGVDIFVATEVAVDAADYWDIVLVRRTEDGDRYALETVTTSTRKLKANTALRLADSDTGTFLEPGDTLLLDVQETGDPVPLEQLAAWPEIRRRVA